MYEHKKAISTTKTDGEFDPIEYGLIAGAVLVIGALIFGATLFGKLAGF